MIEDLLIEKPMALQKSEETVKTTLGLACSATEVVLTEEEMASSNDDGSWQKSKLEDKLLKTVKQDFFF